MGLLLGGAILNSFDLEDYWITAEGKCLIDIIDHTISPMGGRLLKRWLALPSTSPYENLLAPP